MQQKESNRKNCYWKVCFHYLWNVLHFILGYTRFCFTWTRPLLLSFSPFFSPSRSTHSVWKDSRMRWLTGRCDDCECHLHTGEGRRWAPSVKQHSTRIPVPQRAVPGSTWTCCDICPNKHRNTWVKKEHKKHSRGESESECECVSNISLHSSWFLSAALIDSPPLWCSSVFQPSSYIVALCLYKCELAC